MKDLISKVEKLVDQEYTWDEKEDYDLGSLPTNARDSFGEFRLVVNCEPEDAIWYRDLSDNFHSGLSVGVRNTLKVLKENPELLEELTKDKD